MKIQDIKKFMGAPNPTVPLKYFFSLFFDELWEKNDFFFSLIFRTVIMFSKRD